MKSVMQRCASIAAVVGSLGIAACASDATGSSRAVVMPPGGAGSGAGGTPSAGSGGVGSPAGTGGGHAAGSTPMAGTGGMTILPGTGGIMMLPGTGGMTILPGTGGITMLPGTGGIMMLPGSGGRSGSGGAVASGTGGMSAPATDLDGLRQACVDYINMYRATLGKAPLQRATPAQEACSDMGAKQDGDSGIGHGSAGMCPGLGSQNACPGYPVGAGDIAGVEMSMKFCLDQMWQEGAPPEPVNQCIADYQNCFEKYGHWINMTDDNNKVVSCGFYKMSNGNYWMNQDFGF